MAFKALPLPLLLFSLFGFLSLTVSAQTVTSSSKDQEKNFYSSIKNKTWTVSQYLITSKLTDKKFSFKDCTFRFNQEDTSTFLIDNIGTNSMTGHWNPQDNNNVIFSLPLITRDSSQMVHTSSVRPANSASPYETTLPKNTSSDSVYNEVAMLLSGGPMQIIEMNPSKIKFRLKDAMRGDVLVEFIKKD